MRLRKLMLRRLGLLFAAALSVPAGAGVSMPAPQPRIVGGVEATPGSWPWMAAIVTAGEQNLFFGQFCGGTVIHPNWVLTAAHCFLDSTNTFVDTGKLPDVVVGIHNLNTDSGQRVAASRILAHPNYDPVSNDNDIALLQLASPVGVSSVMKLPGPIVDASVAAAGTQATAIGWGNTSSTGNVYLPELRQVNLPLVDNSTCQTAVPTLTGNMLCAGDALGARDTCQGDSGGPLVAPINGAYTQLGVTSFGLGCATINNYGVYARVSRYAMWISANLCAPQDLPSAPQINVNVAGNLAQLSFSPVATATGYRLYYAPSPGLTPVQQFDLGVNNSLSVSLASGTQMGVAVLPYNGVCQGGLSNIVEFLVP